MRGPLRTIVKHILPLAALAAFAVASSARAEDECGIGGTCVRIEDINPKYLHFYVYNAAPGDNTHWNMLFRGRQSELARVRGASLNRSVRTYIAAEPGSSHRVQFQQCRRTVTGASVCGPWGAITLAKPAAAAAELWAAVAVDGKGRWGYAVGKPTAAQARGGALAGCGSGCRIEKVLRARCLAYSESRERGYWYYVHFGAPQSSVEESALDACRKAAPTGSCKLVKAVCG